MTVHIPEILEVDESTERFRVLPYVIAKESPLGTRTQTGKASAKEMRAHYHPYPERKRKAGQEVTVSNCSMKTSGGSGGHEATPLRSEDNEGLAEASR